MDGEVSLAPEALGQEVTVVVVVSKNNITATVWRMRTSLIWRYVCGIIYYQSFVSGIIYMYICILTRSLFPILERRQDSAPTIRV